MKNPGMSTAAPAYRFSVQAYQADVLNRKANDMENKLIHRMKVNEDLAVLDVNSGAVHLLDQATYDVLGIFNGNNDEETVAALKDSYEETELREILSELHELMEQGLLFSPDFDVPETFATEPVLKSLCLHVAHDCNLRIPVPACGP